MLFCNYCIYFSNELHRMQVVSLSKWRHKADISSVFVWRYKDSLREPGRRSPGIGKGAIGSRGRKEQALWKLELVLEQKYVRYRARVGLSIVSNV